MSDPATGTEWAYAHLNDESIRTAVRRNVGTLMMLTSDARPMAIGTCFVVSRWGTQVLAFTAGHVIDAALREAAPQRLRARPLSDWPPHILNACMGKVFFYFGEQDYGPPPTLSSFYVSPESDMAWVVIDARGVIAAQPGVAVVAIDSDIHFDDTEIIAICGTDLAPRATESADTFQLDPAIQLRAGRIRRVLRRGRLVQNMTYETTIPFAPGMSGSPVLCRPSDSPSSMAAIGIVSSDLSEHGSHDDPRVGGLSSVMPIGAVYGLGFTYGDGKVGGIDELCRNGSIVDVGGKRDDIVVVRLADDSYQVTLPIASGNAMAPK